MTSVWYFHYLELEETWIISFHGEIFNLIKLHLEPCPNYWHTPSWRNGRQSPLTNIFCSDFEDFFLHTLQRILSKKNCRYIFFRQYLYVYMVFVSSGINSYTGIIVLSKQFFEIPIMYKMAIKFFLFSYSYAKYLCTCSGTLHQWS